MDPCDARIHSQFSSDSSGRWECHPRLGGLSLCQGFPFSDLVSGSTASPLCLRNVSTRGYSRPSKRLTSKSEWNCFMNERNDVRCVSSLICQTRRNWKVPVYVPVLWCKAGHLRYIQIEWQLNQRQISREKAVSYDGCLWPWFCYRNSQTVFAIVR